MSNPLSIQHVFFIKIIHKMDLVINTIERNS